MRNTGADNNHDKPLRYRSRTAHRTGQPYFGLGEWLLYQERAIAAKSVDEE